MENKKKQYCQANCFDAERAFFDIDQKRRGFIDLDTVRFLARYLLINLQFKKYIQSHQDQHPQTPTGQIYQGAKKEEEINERDMEMLYFYLNRKDLPKIKLDDVSNSDLL